ncbi:MAG: cation transporter [Alphaproteobacteria bacterium]
MAALPATQRRTFGYQRAGVVAAFVNSLVLLGAVAGLAVMAVRRLIHLAGC